MLGVAGGNDNKQIEVYKKQFRVFFPVVPDKSGEVFKVLGVPGTPYMILTTKEGKVLMNHIGVIEDLDQMLKEIRELHKQQ
jgi:hypothetical protein